MYIKNISQEIRNLKKSDFFKFTLVTLLSVICLLLTFYFHIIVKTGAVFSHFFYIPIILASLWWQRKGILVALFLSLVLIISNNYLREHVVNFNDYFRAIMFVLIAITITFLSEKISEVQRKINHYNHILHSIRGINLLISKKTNTASFLQGICDNLTDKKSYNNSWILLTDDKMNITKYAEKHRKNCEINLTKCFTDKILPPCSRQSLGASGIFIFHKEHSLCLNCDYKTDLCDNGIMMSRLEYSQKIYGLIGVTIEKFFLSDTEGHDLFNEASKDIAYALHSLEMEKIRRIGDIALQNSERRLIQIIHGSSIPVYVIDPNHKISHWNKACEILTGLESQSMINTSNHWEAFYDNKKDSLADMIVDSKELGSINSDINLQLKKSSIISEAFETEKFFPDMGEEGKWLFVSAAPIHDIDGNITGAIETIQDITERKNAEKKIIELNKNLENRVRERTRELEAANGELKDFAHIVSHDLKAPLRAISKLSNWLIHDHYDSINEDGQEKLDLIINRVKRMDRLIDGILQYSRMGREKTGNELVDLNRSISDAIEIQSIPNNLRLKIQKGLPTVAGNRIRFEQIFQNLISNAVKFMDKPDGIIKINCKDSSVCWTITVSDNGPGIDQKYHEKIFQIFQTLSSRDEHENTGIGLTLVKRIIENYGGNIWIDSTPGIGSNFHFTLLKGTTNEK